MAIELDRAGERIHLRSPYDPRTVAGCKRVPGAGWSKRAKAWTFPLSIESCKILREEFGPELQIRKALSQWYRDEASKRDALGSLAQAEDAELTRLPLYAPALAKALGNRPYQRAGARFIVDGGSVLIADDPGLGKTLEALAAVVESGVPGPYLVVSPKTAARTVWPPHIRTWLPDHSAIDFPEGRAKRDALLDGLAEVARQNAQQDFPVADARFTLDRTWVSIHPEMVMTKSFWVCQQLETDIAGTESRCDFREPCTTKPTSVLGCGHEKTSKTPRINEHVFPQLFEINWGVIIVDESHECLVRKTGTPTQRRNGLELLSLRPNGFKIAMSGTPWRDKPWQLWGTLNWLAPRTYTGFWRWAEQYWDKGGYSGWEIGKIKPEREQMLWDSLKPVMLRRTKAEVAKDLPPKTYVGTPYDPADEHSPVGIWLPMEGKQKKAYDQMAEQGWADVEGGTVDTLGVLAELTRLSQFATSFGQMDKGDFSPNLPSNKFDWCEQFFTELGIGTSEPTGKVIVVSRFTKLLNMFSFGLGLGGKSCMLTGEVSGAKREKVIADFNKPVGSDSPHIMFLNVKAGGVAITIDSADDMVMLDESGADAMLQVEDRIHRVSKPRPVRYHYLRSIGTTDVGAALVNAQRGADGRRLLDERRGVEFYRKVMEASRD